VSRGVLTSSVVCKTVVVEIGNDWVKIVESTPDRVFRVYCKPLLEITGPVEEALARAFRTLGLNKNRVVLSVPRHLVTARLLELPSVDPKEIQGMVNLQVGKQTPYSKEEILFDYTVIGPGREGYSRILLVIARRNLIHERVEVLRKADIRVGKVVMSSEGTCQWFRIAIGRQKAQAERGKVVVVDMDSNYSDFLVLDRGRLVFTRNILIGTKHLLTERTKWEEKFLNEVLHTRDLYLQEDQGANLEQVFLAGASKSIKDLPSLLGKDWRVPVVQTTPIQNIRVRGDIDILQYAHFKQASVCSLIGSSMRPSGVRLDLTPDELRIRRLMEKRTRQVVLLGVLITAVVMLISVLVGVRIYRKKDYLDRLKQTNAAIEKEAAAVERMRAVVDLVRDRLDARRRTLNILREIHRLTPKEIYFTNINIEEKKKVVLQGNAFALSNVFAFVTILENSPVFENVKTTYTTAKRRKGKEYTRFEIVCLLEKGTP